MDIRKSSVSRGCWFLLSRPVGVYQMVMIRRASSFATVFDTDQLCCKAIGWWPLCHQFALKTAPAQNRASNSILTMHGIIESEQR
eukprot:scaffold2551_cov113-Cylindrotheca_fusiformis.AAC.27